MQSFSFIGMVVCGMFLILASPAWADSASLTVSGTVISPDTPVANFTANVTTGYAPLTVLFTDLSTNNPTEWGWDFETDGTIDALVPDPVQTYASPGVYTVSLTVLNTEGSDTEIKLDYITVLEPDPMVRIEALKQYIQGSPIPGWAQWFLIKPLDRALDQLEKGNMKPASNQMRSFVNFVELLHGFGVITDEQAAYMNSEAMAIIDLIGR
ncbi:MAG TPA: PKD domain-containing protein [Methanoregulaceae archaeon]|nr:PKD domain-containing protein [Methanoregulaceae archaeon]